MKKETLKILIDPNDGTNDLEVYAYKVLRGDSILSDLHHTQVLNDDEILSGFIHNRKNGNLFPIRYGIGSILRSSDLLPAEFRDFFASILVKVPEEYRHLVRNYLEKLELLSAKTEKAGVRTR